MLISFLLFTFSSSIAETSVPFLTNRTFASTVENRQHGEIWVILFTRSSLSGDDEFQSVSKVFKKAAKISMGMNFAVVDVYRESSIAPKYGIQKIPSIHIFYDDGDIEYIGTFQASEIIKKAAAFINDYTQEIKEDWKKSLVNYPAAMLFQESLKTPLVWKAISSYYHKKSIRIGFTNNSDLFFPFGIKRSRTVLLSNGTHQKSIEYFFESEENGETIIKNKKMNFLKLTDIIDKFFFRSLTQDVNSQIIKEFSPPKKFREICVGSRTHCILIKSKEITNEIKSIKKSYGHMKMNWFLGDDNLPYDFMKLTKGSKAWIYNPRRDSFISSGIENLSDTLESIINGNVKWVKREEMLEEL